MENVICIYDNTKENLEIILQRIYENYIEREILNG